MPDAVETRSNEPSVPPAAMDVGAPSEPPVPGAGNADATKPPAPRPLWKKLVLLAALFVVALPAVAALLSFVLVRLDSPKLPQELRASELVLQLPEDKELFQFDAMLVRYLRHVKGP